jgi:hypothetical protein
MQSTYMQAWAQRGACVGHPHPEWWEAPAKGGNLTPAVRARQDLAIAVCETCPVTEECLAAVDRFDAGQVRGGVRVTHRMVGSNGSVLSWPRLPPAHGTIEALRAHAKAKEPFCPVCRDADQRRHVMENGWPE